MSKIDMINLVAIIISNIFAAVATALVITWKMSRELQKIKSELQGMNEKMNMADSHNDQKLTASEVYTSQRLTSLETRVLSLESRKLGVG